MRLCAFLGILFSQICFADQTCETATAARMIRCGAHQSLERKRADQSLRISESLAPTLKQSPQHTIEGEFLQAGSASETVLTWLVSIPVGSHRQSLLDGAQNIALKAQTQRDLDLAQLQLRSLLKMYRLSHLRREIQIEEESIATYKVILSQYRRRSALSPEQLVSVSLFQMAQQERDLAVTKLKSEQETLYSDLETDLQISRSTLAHSLPDRKTHWPEPPTILLETVSPWVRLEEFELQISKSEVNQEKSKIFSEIRVGPQARLQYLPDGSRDNFLGVSFSFPIPLPHQNQAGIELARSKQIAAEISYAQSQAKDLNLQNQLKKRYKMNIENLTKLASQESTDTIHARIEKHFLNGLVPGSMILEAHRQWSDLERQRGESERDAIETLGWLQILNNSFDVESL